MYPSFMFYLNDFKKAERYICAHFSLSQDIGLHVFLNAHMIPFNEHTPQYKLGDPHYTTAIRPKESSRGKERGLANQQGKELGARPGERTRSQGGCGSSFSDPGRKRNKPSGCRYHALI
uniref:Uncharacterized protein n=1 Tax=Oryza barthii TaxID=65489 RepID=A0A0D3HP57_9ORYZ